MAHLKSRGYIERHLASASERDMILDMTDEYDRDELADLAQAIRLLAGFSKKEWPAPSQQYLSGAEEDVGRQALRRLLLNRKPLDSLIRHLLADLVWLDPDAPRSGFFGPVDRKLFFSKPTGREDARTAKIALEVMRSLELDTCTDHRGERPIRTKEAIAAVAKKLNIEERGVRDMWERYQPEVRKRLKKAIKARAKETIKRKKTPR